MLTELPRHQVKNIGVPKIKLEVTIELYVFLKSSVVSVIRNNKHLYRVEIKCQLDATEVFIADLIACSTCFGHHHAHHQELKSIIQWYFVLRTGRITLSSTPDQLLEKTTAQNTTV